MQAGVFQKLATLMFCLPRHSAAFMRRLASCRPRMLTEGSVSRSRSPGVFSSGLVSEMVMAAGWIS